MNFFKTYLLFISILNLNLLEAIDYCPIDYSLEIKKGEDICYKYDKKTDTRIEIRIKSPDKKSQWKLFIDEIGLKDVWKKEIK